MLKKLSTLVVMLLVVLTMGVSAYASTVIITGPEVEDENVTSVEKYLSSFKQDFKNTSNRGVAFTWKPKNTKYKYFDVYISSDYSNGYAKKTPWKTNSKKYTISNLKSGSVYYIQIKLYKNKSDKSGVFSKVYKVYTKTSRVDRIGQKTATKDTITLSWNKVTNAKGYTVYGIRGSKLEKITSTSKNTYSVKFSKIKKYDEITVKSYIIMSNGNKLEGEDALITFCVDTAVLKPSNVNKKTVYFTSINWLNFESVLPTACGDYANTQIKIYKYNDLKNEILSCEVINDSDYKEEISVDIEQKLRASNSKVKSLSEGTFYVVKMRNYTTMENGNRIYSDWITTYHCKMFQLKTEYLSGNKVRLKYFNYVNYDDNSLKPSGVSGIDIYVSERGKDEKKLVKTINKSNPTDIVISNFADGTPLDKDERYTVYIHPFIKVGNTKYYSNDTKIDYGMSSLTNLCGGMHISDNSSIYK